MLGRILLVEDDEMTRETIELLLNHRGYIVRACPTGKEIFKTINDFKPHLILLDILLGELDGRDICRQIKKDSNYSDIPVIVISGAPDLYNSICAEGANDIVLKPFEERTLVSRIERQLSSHYKLKSNTIQDMNKES